MTVGGKMGLAILLSDGEIEFVDSGKLCYERVSD